MTFEIESHTKSREILLFNTDLACCSQTGMCCHFQWLLCTRCNSTRLTEWVQTLKLNSVRTVKSISSMLMCVEMMSLARRQLFVVRLPGKYACASRLELFIVVSKHRSCFQACFFVITCINVLQSLSMSRSRFSIPCSWQQHAIRVTSMLRHYTFTTRVELFWSYSSYRSIQGCIFPSSFACNSILHAASLCMSTTKFAGFFYINCSMAHFRVQSQPNSARRGQPIPTTAIMI